MINVVNCDQPFKLYCHTFQALLDICAKVSKATHPRSSQSAAKTGSGITDRGGARPSQREGKPFDSMNNIVANLLLNLTRFI